MAEVLLLGDLKRVINARRQATTGEERQAVAEVANEILENFVNGNFLLDVAAADVFGEFLDLFAGTRDANGNLVLSQIGAQAMAKYESFINQRGGRASQPGASQSDASQSNAENGVKNRIYSLNADANQIKFDLVSLGIFQSMGLIDRNLNPNNMTPAQVAAKIDGLNLNDEQRQEYAARFVDVVINDATLYESVPPSILANAYTATRVAMIAETDAEAKEKLQKRFAALATRIDFLIENFSSQINYWYIDPSNIMDVHDGYAKMFDVRQPDLQPVQNQNQATIDYNARINAAIDDSRHKLTSAIKEYDELYHLTQANPENADELKQRWIELKSRLGEIQVTPETLAIAAKYQFLDSDGNPMPQFMDEHDNPSLEYRDGYKLNPNGRLARVFNLSRNDVVMENVADLEHRVEDMNLAEMLNEEVPWTIAEISIPDQVAQGIVQAPEKMKDETYVQEFWDNIKVNGGSISDVGYQAALDAHVNHAAGFAARMAQKVGADKDVVYMPFQAVQDIDKLASTRSETQGGERRKQKVGFFKRMAKNFGVAAAVSAGLTFIGKATGIAWAGAAVGTTIGVGNMIYQGLKWRKEQKKAGKPHGIKEFLSDKRNWGPAVTTGLGVAATICMATGNPELAMGFGLGAVATGTGTSAAMVYKDAINAGYSRGQALAGAIGVGASGILGAWAGNAAMNGIVNYVNNNTDCTLFKHAETVQTQHTEYETSTQRQYADGVIESNERLMLEHNWETQQSFDARINGLMDAGLSRDDAVRYLLAFHDATDHNLGPGYFDSIGMSPDNLAALRNSINGTEINLTPESMAAFEHFNPHISAINQVGYVPGAPVDFTLPPNAAYDANGVLVHGNELYSTYANHSAPVFTDSIVHTPITTYGTETIFTPNELAFPAGIGTFGIYEPRIVPADYMRSLRHRAGALADRIKIEHNQGPIEPVDPVNPIDPIDPVNPDNPDNPDNPVGPVNPRRRRRPINEHDLELDASLNLDKNNEENKKIVNVKVNGKMENIQVNSNVSADSMHIDMVVPYALNQGPGYYKVVDKKFGDAIKEARMTSRATADGIHISIEYDGVSIKKKGRYKLFFQYVADENQTEYAQTIKKTSRFAPSKSKQPLAEEQNETENTETPENKKKESKNNRFNKAKKQIELGGLTPTQYADGKAKRAKKESAKFAWNRALAELAELSRTIGISDEERQMRANDILAAAQASARG